MRIIFGHNSFVIKRVNSKELGIADENYEIQLRQKYAHLYFIPVFPIGKVWVAKRNGQLYDIPEHLKDIVSQQYSARTHWGAFALPILLILGFAFYFINEKFEHMRWEKQEEMEMIDNANKMTSSLYNITNENTHLLFSKHQGDYFNTEEDLVFEVLKIESNKLLLGKLIKKEDTIRKGIYMELPKIVNRSVEFRSFVVTDSFWVDKKEIEKTIQKNKEFSMVQIPSLSNDKLRLLDINILEDSYFLEDTDTEARSEFYTEYRNYGLDVILDSIVPDTKGEEWKLSKNKDIKFGEKFAIQSGSFNSAKLFYHFPNKKKSQYVVVKKSVIQNKYDIRSSNLSSPE